ncbi:MAG TPA: hypothetical protein VLH56_00175 [Dissulfurispiraceae bacterium]|nr:hypothetical protein [Dissulfurispiraceae bacterium]
MGGDGSGRIAEGSTVAELLMSDEQFADNVRIKTVQDYNAIVAKLAAIATGHAVDYVLDSKNGILVQRPASIADVVKAAKVWAEMTLNKVVADKKQIGDGSQGSLLDYLEAANGVAKEIAEHKQERIKRSEAAAEVAGKLARIGES